MAHLSEEQFDLLLDDLDSLAPTVPPDLAKNVSAAINESEAGRRSSRTVTSISLSTIVVSAALVMVLALLGAAPGSSLVQRWNALPGFPEWPHLTTLEGASPRLDGLLESTHLDRVSIAAPFDELSAATHDVAVRLPLALRKGAAMPTALARAPKGTGLRSKAQDALTYVLSAAARIPQSNSLLAEWANSVGRWRPTEQLVPLLPPGSAPYALTVTDVAGFATLTIALAIAWLLGNGVLLRLAAPDDCPQNNGGQIG